MPGHPVSGKYTRFPHLPLRDISTRKKSFRDPYTYYYSWVRSIGSDSFLAKERCYYMHGWLFKKKARSEVPEQENFGEEYEQAVISMCAPNSQYYCTKTLKLKGSRNSVPICALIDSGSTHSFVNPSVVLLSQIKTVPTTPMVVRTASGTKLLSESKCEQLKFKLQQHEFEGELRVLDVQGYDLIFGIDWLSSVGPMTVDWGRGTIQLKHGLEDITLQVQEVTAEVKLALSGKH